MIAANSASSSSYDVRISARIVRVDGADRPADLDAGAVGKPRVEHRHVGAQRRDAGGGLRGQPGLADHDDVAGRLQQRAQSVPDDLVVVEQEDADPRGASPMG